VIDAAAYLGRAGQEGAPSDGDDAIALNEALECAASRSHPTTLALAPGRYLLRTPLRPRSDHLTITGTTGKDGSPATTLVADPCNPAQLPGAIQASDVPLAGLTVRALRIELRDGPRLPPGDPRATSNSGIQLDRCSGCTVEDIEMEYTGGEPPECKPYNLDGITFAMGSYGAVRGVRISGVPKAGIYAASHTAAGPLLIERSEVRRCDGPLGATGISILASDVTVRSSWSHDNVAHPFPARGAPAARGNGLLLFATPPGRSSPAAAPSRIRVEDSVFDDNGGNGVQIASMSATSRPTDVLVTRVLARRNGAQGFLVEAGEAIRFSGVEAAGNGHHGILVTAETSLPVEPSARIGAVSIEEAVVHDNGAEPRFRADPRRLLIVPGIGIKLAPGVTIVGGRSYRTEGSPGTQYAGVGVYPRAGDDCARQRCVHLEGFVDQTGLLGAPPAGAASDFRVPQP
jgi:hypothetical protein